MENLIAALAKSQGEFKPIPKNKKMQVSKTPPVYVKYADLADVLSIVTPVLSKNGLALIQTIEKQNDGAALVTTLYHVSGEKVFSTYDLPCPRVTRAHLMGSALTYARRYSACAILGITGDDDDDGQLANEKMSQPPKPTPIKKPEPPKNMALERVMTADEIDRFYRVFEQSMISFDDLLAVTQKLYNKTPVEINVREAGQVVSMVKEKGAGFVSETLNNKG